MSLPPLRRISGVVPVNLDRLSADIDDGLVLWEKAPEPLRTLALDTLTENRAQVEAARGGTS